MKIVTTIASDIPTIGTTSLGIMLSGFHCSPWDVVAPLIASFTISLTTSSGLLRAGCP